MEKLILLLIFSLFFVSTCEPEDELIRTAVNQRIENDIAYLANIQAVYQITFANHQENFIYSDDIYLRKDLAKVFYGFNINEIEVEIKSVDNSKILSITLPEPQRISIDRKILELESTHLDYKPVDRFGDYIDVDKNINEKLNLVLETYDAKTIELTKKIGRQYFKKIAERFGMKLEINYYIKNPGG